ncbi:MAG: thioredoxin-dependent thiol peroxidase [Bacteroidota bacterium]|nr:thioredoxin-dependent thiol peroxidase [Bacteroidota bacterium]
MAVLKIGNKAPNFLLQSNDGKTHALKDFFGKKIVLFFYPKDDTPTCTKQVCSFRDNLSGIEEKGAVVIGISPDGIKSHNKFVLKYKLNFQILSDETKKVIKKYGVWNKKILFGRKYMGVVRTTYIINEEGRISHIFPKVLVNGHINKVLKVLAE